MRLELVAVRIEEINRIALAPVLLPFRDAVRPQPVQERCEILLVETECVVGVIRLRTGGFQVVQRQAKPQVAEREVGAGIPGGVEAKVKEAVIKIDASAEVRNGQRQVIQSSQHVFFLDELSQRGAVPDVKMQVLRVLVSAQVGSDPARPMTLFDIGSDEAHHVKQAMDDFN